MRIRWFFCCYVKPKNGKRVLSFQNDCKWIGRLSSNVSIRTDAYKYWNTGIAGYSHSLQYSRHTHINTHTHTETYKAGGRLWHSTQSRGIFGCDSDGAIPCCSQGRSAYRLGLEYTTHTEFDSLTYDRHTYINLWCVTGDFSKALPKQIGFSWWVNMKFLGNSKMPERNSSSV